MCKTIIQGINSNIADLQPPTIWTVPYCSSVWNITLPWPAASSEGTSETTNSWKIPRSIVALSESNSILSNIKSASLRYITTIVPLGSQQINVDRYNQRSQPHSQKQNGESLLDGSSSTEGSHWGGEEWYDQGSPEIPLLFYFLVALTVSAEGGSYLEVDIHDVSFLDRGWFTIVSMTGS